MKKLYLLVVVATIICHSLAAQCLSSREGSSQSAEISSSSGNEAIDRQIRTLVTSFNRVLSVSSKFYFYDDNAGSNAYANPEDNNIYIGTNLLEECLDGDVGMTGLAFILAHEMSHIYQFAHKDDNE